MNFHYILILQKCYKYFLPPNSPHNFPGLISIFTVKKDQMSSVTSKNLFYIQEKHPFI